MKKSLKITYQDNYFTGLDANSCFWWQEMILHSSFPCILSIKKIPVLCPRQIPWTFGKVRNMETYHRCFRNFYLQRSPAPFCQRWNPSMGKLGDLLPELSSREQNWNPGPWLHFMSPGLTTRSQHTWSGDCDWEPREIRLEMRSRAGNQAEKLRKDEG